jgi:hypothetical protein
MSSITSIKNVNVSEITVLPPRAKTGKRFLNVFYNKKPLVIKFPKLRIPFKSNISKFNQIEFNLTLGDNNELIEKIEELDTFFEGLAKSEEWFVDGVTPEYTSILKRSNNDAYPPTLKFKIPKRSNVISCSFFDAERNPVTVTKDDDVLDLLTQHSHVITACEVASVWIMGDKYGVAWKLEQARVYPPAPRNFTDEDYNFEDSSDDENIKETECLIDDE